MQNTPRLVLASESARRADLLREAGFAFEVLPARVDESPLPGEKPAEMTLRLASAKARAALTIAATFAPNSYILGADTAVILEGVSFGKPSSPADAARMLRALSGKAHIVLTGVCVIRIPGLTERTTVESTSVTFAQLSDDEIDAYVSSGEPFDKAGGYAIQGRASRFVTRIEGCYSNVVGLPISLVWALLRDLGWPESMT